MIKAIIFDLDGVLVDATQWHYRAMNKALALFGYTITSEEHHGSYNGLPTREKLKYLSKEKGLPEVLHDIIYTMKQKYTQDMIEQFCRSDHEKHYMLMMLKKRGFRMAVCSNAISRTVEVILNKLEISHFFEFALSNQDITKPKPDPQIYLKAFDTLRLKPTECLIIEDAKPGIEAAEASGAFVLKVKGYYQVNYKLITNFLNTIKEDRRC